MQRRRCGFKWTLHLAFAVTALVTAFCMKGWVQETQGAIIEDPPPPPDETTVNYDWWQNLDTTQTYTVTHEDGTTYEMTVNPDGSSVETVTTPDGQVTTEITDAPTFNSSVMTQRGTFITSNGDTLNYTFTVNSVDGSYSLNSESHIPEDILQTWSFSENNDRSTDFYCLWKDGKFYQHHTEPPDALGLIAGHWVFIPLSQWQQSANFVWYPDDSAFVQLSGRLSGITEEAIFNADGSGNLTAKDSEGNVVGTITWDANGVQTNVTGVYAQ